MDRSTSSLEARVAHAADSPEELRRLFDAEVARVGRRAASASWWAVFAATDATET